VDGKQVMMLIVAAVSLLIWIVIRYVPRMPPPRHGPRSPLDIASPSSGSKKRDD
jgi:hypothetical protein